MFWIFGDSYSERIISDNDISFCWIESVPKYFNQEVINLSLGSTSLSYTYSCFESKRNEIQPNDIIIICLTHINRQWFFIDRPMLSDSWSFDHHEDFYKIEEKNAFEYYNLYLNNIKNQELGLINFLYNLNQLAENKVKIIVLSSFPETELIYKNQTDRWPNLNFSKGSLMPISYQEIHDNDRDIIKETRLKRDPRAGHFLKSTHPILTNKIIKNITENTLLDLTIDFPKGIITLDKINDKEFVKNEFFYNILL